MIYFFTFVLAFCSIVYELLLGQVLSAFLGDTVLRYSVTIGLYMFSMGIGALLVRGRLLVCPLLWLQWIETVLAMVGGYSIVALFFLEAGPVPHTVFTLAAHLLIILIGILSGAEIPLLIEIRRQQQGAGAAGRVLGIDYVGAFTGTLVFAFFFYPIAGLVLTAFSTAAANALVGLLLFTQRRSVPDRLRMSFHAGVIAQALCLLALLVSLWQSQAVSEYLVILYLRG